MVSTHPSAAGSVAAFSSGDKTGGEGSAASTGAAAANAASAASAAAAGRLARSPPPAAARRLAGNTVVTPLIEQPALNERIGGRVLLKAETLQRTGSFKFRGAFNRLSRIPEPDRPAGVVSYSSGNHAQGVAAAAKLWYCKW